MLGLYWRLVWARERSNMQYRVTFWLLTLTSCLFVFQDYLAILFFFDHIPTFAGWSLYEVSFLYAFSAFAFRVGEFLATGFDMLPSQLRQGTFDRVLVRPMGPFFQTLAAGLALRRIGAMPVPIALMAISSSAIGISWTVDKVALLLVAMVAGVAIYFAIFVCGAAYCFWAVQGTELINTFTNGGQFVTGYPLDAFGDWLRRAITFLIPVAFVNYYPTLYLLDRSPPMGLPDWIRLASPLVAALVAFVAWRFWQAGVRRYTSTGS